MKIDAEKIENQSSKMFSLLRQEIYDFFGFLSIFMAEKASKWIRKAFNMH